MLFLLLVAAVGFAVFANRDRREQVVAALGNRGTPASFDSHTHETLQHSHEHTHVTHHHRHGATSALAEWEHLTSMHTHEHNHPALQHSHAPHENVEREHLSEAHIHDHSHPATS